MADNRDRCFPGGQPGFPGNMMSGASQFVQPGMQCYPMMQQQMGMNPAMNPAMNPGGMVPQMYPMQQYAMNAPRMTPPRMAPPSYSQHMSQNFSPRTAVSGRGPQPRPPPSQKDIQFQMQQQRLKQFGQTKDVKADADKFIESMFGKTEKPKSKDAKQKPTLNTTPAQQTSAPMVTEDDGFGDFLQGPMTTPPQSQLSAPSMSSPSQISSTNLNTGVYTSADTSPNTCQPVAAGTAIENPPQQKPQQEKKDLMAMMMESCDFKAPPKAKSFQKPLVKDVQVQPHKTITYHQSNQARQWQSTTELEGLFHENIPKPEATPLTHPVQSVPNDLHSQTTAPSASTMSTAAPPATTQPSNGILPDWCMLPDDKLPPLYRMVHEAALIDGKIDTNRLYPILVLSNLPREVLGYIWSIANVTTPGQLIMCELNAVLALIALAQNNHSIMSIDILKRCPQPPIPFLGQTANPAQAQTQQGNQTTIASPASTTVSNTSTVQTPANSQPVIKGPNGVQATIPSPSSSFQVVSPTPQVAGTGSPAVTSEPAIITHTTEDDFADFQSASKADKAEDEFGDFMGTNNPACISVEEKPPYIISVPKPDPKIIDQMTPDEKYNSNVRSFFGSSGSSGHTTPNSLDEEDYTDCRDSTSQFSTSEQSENEDIKVFESYVEEFNRKKEMLHPESPLHNPFPRLPVVEGSSSNAVIPPLPPVIGGLQLSSEATTSNDFTDFKAAPSSKATESDIEGDFSDFQAGPKVTGTDLMGAEDKYGALRSLVLDDTVTSSEPIESSAPTIAPFEEKVEESDNDWADFASALPDTDSKSKSSNTSTISLSTDNLESGWADFGDTKTPTSSAMSNPPSWISSGSNSDSKNDFVQQQTPTDNLFPTVSIKTDSTTEDDWCDFSTAPPVVDQQTPIPQPSTQDDWFNSPAESVNSSNSNNVITVKKSNLQSSEIMSMFKVRDDPSTQASYKLPNIEQKMNKVRQISLDNESDHDPPPLDDHEDEDDQTFSRGYDLGDFDNPSPISGYGYGNSNKTVFLNQVAKKVVEKRSDERDRTSLSPETEDESCSSKDTDSFNWKDRSKHLREDSQSVCSLELPVKGNKLGSDNGGSDSQSVSSMEFGNFEGSSRAQVSAESKSLDSLDFQNEGVEIEVVDANELDNSGASTNNNKNMNQSGLATGVMKALADRYNITDEIVTSDRYSYEWERCLDNCCRMIKDSNTIFNSISSSSVCNEVIKSSKGSSYITGVIEIYRVACRVLTAMRAHNLGSPTLEKLAKEIDLAWNNLTAFFVGASILPDSKTFEFKHAVMKSDNEEAQYIACGVCLLNVDSKIRATWGDEDVTKLTYGRRQYHAPCANFWVNCVDSTLPGLCLPELL